MTQLAVMDAVGSGLAQVPFVSITAMAWPSPNSFREPEVTPVVEATAVPRWSQEAIALSVSAVTLPLLGGLVLSRWAMAGLTQLGSASEELFRGDRLPLLHDQHQEGDC